MRLIRVDDHKEIPMAEIRGDQVVYLHPTIKRVIDRQGRVVLPALKNYQTEFGGYSVSPEHEKWVKALQIYLTFNWVYSNPKIFRWIENNRAEYT